MHLRAEGIYGMINLPSSEGDSVSKKLFGTPRDCRESSKDKQLSPVSVHRYGKARVAQ